MLDIPISEVSRLFPTPKSNTMGIADRKPSSGNDHELMPEWEYQATQTNKRIAASKGKHPVVHSPGIEELPLEHKVPPTSNSMASSSDNQPWALSLDVKKLLAEDTANVEHPSVRRVPPFIRNLKPHFYNPDVVHMGLYNRNFIVKSSVDDLKLELLRCFLGPLKVDDQDGWKTFCNRVSSTADAPSLMNFYENDGTYSSLTPASIKSILVIDAFFIVAQLILWTERQNTAGGMLVSDANPQFIRDIFQIFYREDVICAVNSESVSRDVWWLWEGQIPLFLIRNMWQSVAAEAPIGPFRDALKVRLKQAMNRLLSEGWTIDDSGFDECDHLLACLQKSLSWFCPDGSEQDQASRNQGRCCLPSATQLAKSGIRFKGIADRSIGKTGLVKSYFRLSATLYLPMIAVEDCTEKLLLNMCVYESIKHKGEVHDWVQFMDELINTEEDVELMMDGNFPIIKDIVLGDNKQVVAIFTNLLQGFTFRPTEEGLRWLRLRYEIMTWYDNRWRRAAVTLRHRFRGEPWLFSSLFAAIVLLVLTFLQTVYTILGYNKSF
ncbi:hypothetical protein R1sor_002003 [Riccia sorocarpa]|uniref:Uncharacterized protein n=1 Tax=Riccia sorocarpa TaxID=122646 RepID=A0ABD3H1R1_9MARC